MPAFRWAARLDLRQLGALGERIAASVLSSHGADIVARNVEVGRGEVDLIGRMDGQTIVFEVRSRRGGEAVDGFDHEKVRQVRSLARQLNPPIQRVDLVAVDFRHAAVEVHWMPEVI